MGADMDLGNGLRLETRLKHPLHATKDGQVALDAFLSQGADGDPSSYIDE
jgi:hypothetical protein